MCRQQGDVLRPVPAQSSWYLYVASGLWDPHVDVHMGDCAELCAQHYQISREEMDDHAIETFQRAQAAVPYSRAELVPVPLPATKEEPSGRVLEQDESLQKINTQKLRRLKPYFKQVGQHHNLSRCRAVFER